MAKSKANQKVVPGVVGAAVGAAVGVGVGAAAVALSNKKTRTAVLKKGAKLKQQADRTLAEGRKELDKVRKTLEARTNGMASVQKAVSTKKRTVTRSGVGKRGGAARKTA